jgi:pilus assembly protein CpaC
LKSCNLAALILILSLGMVTVHAQEDPHGRKYLTLYMGIQHQEVLSHLPPGSEFFGDFRNIVDAEVDREKKTLRFTPKRPGLVTMTVHDRKGEKLFEYRIEVRASELTKVVREVRALLADIEGITIKIVNNKVIIDGKVLMPEDLNRIYVVMAQYDGRVASFAEVSPIAQQKVAEHIEKHINNPDIEVRAVNGKFILKGIANDDDERTKAVIIAKTYLPAPVMSEAEQKGVVKKRKEEQVINLLAIRAPPPKEPDKLIQLVVHYVEMSKKYLNSNSFRWSPALQDNTEVAFTKDTRTNNDGIVAEISGVISNLLPKLNVARSHGHARILESTSVTTKSGEVGMVKSLTNIPYVAQAETGFNPAATRFEPVGITTTIKPTIENPRSDVILLDTTVEVKALLGNTDAGPQTSENVVKSIINVRSGQSAAIGGLIQNNSTTEYNPDSNPDAIVNLYAARSFNRNKTQFVVFVTPIIKSSASAGSEKIKRKFRIAD